MEEVASGSQKQLKALFTRVDAQLTKRIDIYVIGGAAAILGYNVVKETNDVDIDGVIPDGLDLVFDREAKALKLDLHLSSVGVFSPPEGLECGR